MGDLFYHQMALLFQNILVFVLLTRFANWSFNYYGHKEYDQKFAYFHFNVVSLHYFNNNWEYGEHN